MNGTEYGAAGLVFDTRQRLVDERAKALRLRRLFDLIIGSVDPDAFAQAVRPAVTCAGQAKQLGGAIAGAIPVRPFGFLNLDAD